MVSSVFSQTFKLWLGAPADNHHFFLPGPLPRFLASAADGGIAFSKAAIRAASRARFSSCSLFWRLLTWSHALKNVSYCCDWASWRQKEAVRRKKLRHNGWPLSDRMLGAPLEGHGTAHRSHSTRCHLLRDQNDVVFSICFSLACTYHGIAYDIGKRHLLMFTKGLFTTIYWYPRLVIPKWEANILF